ncbi:hypothetical protein HWQ46_09455 [Shewanella sp. D64]|uniref:hypothetical protein n=1 Tax=unclassified Shewanella TaxID=196818 RepID=UPI0022BA6362|nr:MULTISPECIES: hypothetical protein [unclassified Shewanella]MEC4725768.1 hypothetical protein [Shewanella sp. D64]MEC4737625.1 hypothetical protein [Shewanella sp. E94]WBJ93438.1 hypothetical protein HWQ47_16030 [Shewanella sp. MTB7]
MFNTKSLSTCLTSLMFVMGILTPTLSSAATVGCERAGGIKCQRVVPKRVTRTPIIAPVIIVPKHHHHYRSFHSPILTAMGIAVVLNAAGEAVTEKGQKIIVLGDGNNVSNVYEKDGIVYLIKA